MPHHHSYTGFASGSGVLATPNIQWIKYTLCAVISRTDSMPENQLNGSPVPLTTAELCIFYRKGEHTWFNCGPDVRPERFWLAAGQMNTPTKDGEDCLR